MAQNEEVHHPPPFTYTPLSDAATHIRLLQILRVHENDDQNHEQDHQPHVYARLTVWPLATAPPYHAISYTWGNPNETTHVVINDECMEVRLNCEYVLKQAKWYEDGRPRRRHQKWRGWKEEDKGCYYWCDAICIDQGNNGEKSFQVALMGRIYKNAERVLACVGEEAEGSEMVFSELSRPWDALLLRIVAALESSHASKTRKTNNEVLARMGGVNFSSKAAQRGSIHSRLRRYVSALWKRTRRHDSFWLHLAQALGAFANREYFRRVWIYQELSLGSDIIVCCGQQTASLRLIYGMLTVMYGMSKLARRLRFPADNFDENWDGLQQCEDMVEVGCLTRLDMRRLLDALYTVSQLSCVNARDRVYGVLSLVQWGRHEMPIWPDYTRDAFELGVDVLERLGAFHFRIVMTCLELATSNSEALVKARYLRRRLPTVSALSDHEEHAAAVPAHVPDSAPFTHAFGLCVLEDEGHLHFVPSTSGVLIEIQKWRDFYDEGSESYESHGEKSVIKVVVSDDTKPGDWCIFHKSDACNSGWLVLVARCIDADEITDVRLIDKRPRRRFMIKGKGLVFKEGLEGNVNGGPAVSQLEREFTDSLGAHRRGWFDVYCAAEDALCLETSFAPDIRVDPLTLPDERMSEYFETRFCGKAGSSYAFDIMNHGRAYAGSF